MNTWMAASDMVGAPLEEMGENVRKASRVILCVSSTYEKSAYCMAEASMAMEYNKNMLVLIMEANYKPKNNPKLHPIVALPMRINCYNDEMLDASMEQIFREIEKGIGLWSDPFH